MEYTVKALAELAGVTPRTLRWYDRQGLLKPLRTTEAGCRIYGPEQVDRLQTILFYRELGLELQAIRTILEDPAFDRQKALQSHLAELEARRKRLDGLILTVKNAIIEAKGGNKMSDSQKFEAFKRQIVETNEAHYGKEIREKYVAAYRDRIFYSADRIEKIPYLSLVRPKGTFYLFPGVEKTGLDEKAFCKVLLDQAHVLVSPGTPFGVSAAGHFRIACTVGIDQLKTAFDRMEKLSF